MIRLTNLDRMYAELSLLLNMPSNVFHFVIVCLDYTLDYWKNVLLDCQVLVIVQSLEAAVMHCTWDW